MSDRTNRKVLELIECSVDLTNSIIDDVKKKRRVSDKTINLASNFRKKHDELNTFLAVLALSSTGDPSDYN